MQIFSRKGTEKDVRAQEIEEEEIGRIRKDSEDELRIILAERNKKLGELLHGARSRLDVRSATQGRICSPRRTASWAPAPSPS